MGTFPSLRRSERAPDKLTTSAVRAQDQFLGTVDAFTSPDTPTPSRGLIAKGRDRPPRRLIGVADVEWRRTQRHGLRAQGDRATADRGVDKS